MLEDKISQFFENAENELLPGLTIDVVILGFQDQDLQVLLLKMHELTKWMLPGGYIYLDENIDHAIHRIVRERTGLDALYFHHFELFGNPERTSGLPLDSVMLTKISIQARKWLGQRFVTAGYFALVKAHEVTPTPGGMSASCVWFSVKDLPDTVFDHNQIIRKAIDRLKNQINFLPVAINLLPDRFTMLMLRKLFESILGEKLDRGNFQRKILKLDILIRHEKWKTGKAHKAPYLYSFDQNKYEEKLRSGIGL